MQARPYPKYKPSGVEWLGEVPEHWGVKRLDLLATVKARLGWKGLKADEYVQDGYIFLSTPNIKGEGAIDFENVNYITAERYYESPEIMLQEGDVLIAKDGSTLGIVNLVRSLPAPATVNSSIAVIRPKKDLDESFAFRWLSSAYMQGIINQMKDGQGVPHLFQADVKKFTILLPPLFEQRAIAHFLDTAAAKIDTLVAKKQALIDKLKEKRTALISRTVTRGLPPDAARASGLDPNPKMKPSGVEWIGEVPEHWEVKPFSKVCHTIQTGPFGSQLHQSDYVEGGIPLINPAHIVGSILCPEEDSSVSEETANRLARHRLQSGDIVFARRGEIGRCGIVAANQTGWLCGTGSMVARLSAAFPEFIALLCYYSGFAKELELCSVGTTMKNINPSILGRMMLPVPPMLEQRLITQYLNGEISKVDQMIVKIESVLERLQEYRTALITAAVTGKIDVREAAV